MQTVSLARNLAGLALGLGLLVSACSQPGSPGAPVSGQSGAPAQSAEPPGGRHQVSASGPVKVALLVPLSAENETVRTLGASLETAARMAAADVGATAVTLEVYDTAGQPGQARSEAARALAGGADFIAGPLFAATTRAAGEAVAGTGVPVLSFSTDASVAGPPVYLSGYLPGAQARRIVDYAVARGHRSFGLLYPASPEGDAYAAGFRSAVRGAGAAIVTEMSYQRSFKGIQEASGPFTLDMQAAGASAVIVPEQGEGLRSVAAFLDHAGLGDFGVQYLGIGSWDSAATLQEPALRGGWFPAPEPDRLTLFAQAYEQRFGSKPHKLAVLAYDAVQVAAQLAAEGRASGNSAPFSGGNISRPGGHRGALGPIRFSPDGLSERGLAIVEVGNGQFTTIDPPPDEFGAGL